MPPTNPTPTIFLPYHALDNVILRGTRAQQPAVAAVTPGALYCVTNEGNKVERSSGTAWEAYGLTNPGNVAYVDVANVFTQDQTINKSVPRLIFHSPDAPANARRFRLYGTGAEFGVTANADNDAFQGTPFVVTRAGDLFVGNVLTVTGGQVVFPASQIASGNANTLDDYEEGIWTPSLGGDGGASSGTVYAVREAHYTKIGNVVHCWANLGLTAIGTIPGNVLMGGFPFVSANIAAGGFGITLMFWSAWTTAYANVAHSHLVNDTRGYIVSLVSATGSTGISNTVTAANIGNLGVLRVVVTYRVP